MALDTTEELDTSVLLRGWAAVAPARPEKHAVIAWAARTDMGRVRENNEDKFDFFLPEDSTQLALRGRVWALADGMGGHAAGQIASEAALKACIRAYLDPTASPETEAALRGALSDANALIHHAARQFEGKTGMGTTAVVAVVKEDKLTVGHIGDSRAYLLRQGEAIRQITADHSWVEEQVRRGVMSRPDAEASPYRNYILRSVGVEPTVEADTVTIALQEGDRVLLCSDGLSGYIDGDALAEHIVGKSLSQAALDLIDAANDAGGKDNITVVLLRVDRIKPFQEYGEEVVST